ncbi:MAG: site-specific integrase [Bifidobacteriaceae bacterium]|jgi:integrase|nr:site-specific integrase [Bifidobacteriaceae bacterium]
MASIVKYATKAGETRYRVRYRKPGTNKSTDKSGFSTKKKAELWAAKHTMDVATGEYIDPERGKTTVRELESGWLARKRVVLSSSYFDDIQGSWDKYVEPRWGDVAVKDITKPKVQEWATGLSVEFVNKKGDTEKGKSATVVIRAVGVLAGILDDAKDRRMVIDNTARGIELPKKAPQRHVYLKAKQLDMVAKNSGDNALLVLVLGLVGLRWGEAIGLRVENIDMRRHRMKIWGSATQVQRKIVEGTTKGKKFRSVVYPKILDSMLKKQMEGKKTDDLLFPGNLEGYMRQPRTDAHHHSWWLTALKKSGLNPMRLHDLRHTAASLMVKSGANVKAVQRQLGHSSAAMTLDIYSDLFDDDLDAVGNAMSDLLLKESVGFSWVSGVRKAA